MRHFGGSGSLQIISDERGAATLEYLVVMLSLTIATAIAVAALGPGLVRLFEIRVMWLSLPLP